MNEKWLYLIIGAVAAFAFYNLISIERNLHQIVKDLEEIDAYHDNFFKRLQTDFQKEIGQHHSSAPCK